MAAKRVFSDDEVRLIREQYQAGASFRTLQRTFPAALTSLWNVVRGVSYADIPGSASTPRPRASILDRVRAKIALPPDWESGLSRECWNWTGGMCQGKMPVLTVNGVPLSARRLWDHAPNQQRISLSCRNHRCMNPAHFVYKRRGAEICTMPMQRKAHRMSARVVRKLSRADVIQIRQRYAAGERVSLLTKAFGVTKKTIESLLKGLTYREVPGPLVTALRHDPVEAKRGSQHPHAKVDDEQVLRIVQLAQSGVPKPAIAQEFHVTLRAIYAILYGESWSHVTGILPKAQRDEVFTHWKGGQQAS